MMMGYTFVHSCPSCNNLLSRESLASGNTYGAKAYSDGKTIAIMLPEFPKLTKCRKCKTIFWLNKSTKVGKYRMFEEINESWEQAEEARFLSIYEYFKALKLKVFSSREEELFIRLRIWWGFNDRVRKNKSLFKTSRDKSLWIDNSNHLIKMLDQNDIQQKILVAELYRNFGEFNKSTDLLKSIVSFDLSTILKRYIKECESGNKLVFLF